MKKYIMFFLLMLVSIAGYSQRMIYRQKAVEVNAGILDQNNIGDNYYFNVTLNSFARYGNYWIVGAEYQRRNSDYKQWKIPVTNYLGEAGYSLRLVSDRRKFITVNAGITGVVGYEVVNNGDSILMDGAVLHNRNQLVFGTGGRLSVEMYLSDRIVFMLQGRIKMLWGTDLEKFRPSSGIGVRFNF